MKALFVVLGSVTLSLALIACGKPFQPGPPEFKMWQKPGASDFEIQKALLECGVLNPYYPMYDNTRLTNNEVARYQLCMQKDGFVYNRQTNTFCRNYPNLDACKPENAGAIPSRDINLRLNSQFCKRIQQFEFCK